MSERNPTVTVKSDYDGYFEALVRRWMARKQEFKHREIVITSGPYRIDAVTYRSKDGVLHLDFYSALRAGFGALGSGEIDELVALM